MLDLSSIFSETIVNINLLENRCGQYRYRSSAPKENNYVKLPEILHNMLSGLLSNPLCIKPLPIGSKSIELLVLNEKNKLDL